MPTLPVILYHLDEHIPRAVADGLGRRGIDVSTTVEAGLRSATMVTCDRDFLVLASRGQSHAGIVYYPYGRYPVGEASPGRAAGSPRTAGFLGYGCRGKRIRKGRGNLF